MRRSSVAQCVCGAVFSSVRCNTATEQLTRHQQWCPRFLYQSERDRARSQNKPVIRPLHQIPSEVIGEATDAQIAEARAILDELTEQSRHTRHKKRV